MHLSKNKTEPENNSFPIIGTIGQIYYDKAYAIIYSKVGKRNIPNIKSIREEFVYDALAIFIRVLSENEIKNPGGLLYTICSFRVKDFYKLIRIYGENYFVNNSSEDKNQQDEGRDPQISDEKRESSSEEVEDSNTNRDAQFNDDMEVEESIFIDNSQTELLTEDEVWSMLDEDEKKHLSKEDVESDNNVPSDEDLIPMQHSDFVKAREISKQIERECKNRNTILLVRLYEQGYSHEEISELSADPVQGFKSPYTENSVGQIINKVKRKIENAVIPEMYSQFLERNLLIRTFRYLVINEKRIKDGRILLITLLLDDGSIKLFDFTIGKMNDLTRLKEILTKIVFFETGPSVSTKQWIYCGRKEFLDILDTSSLKSNFKICDPKDLHFEFPFNLQESNYHSDLSISFYHTLDCFLFIDKALDRFQANRIRGVWWESPNIEFWLKVALLNLGNKNVSIYNLDVFFNTYTCFLRIYN